MFLSYFHFTMMLYMAFNDGGDDVYISYHTSGNHLLSEGQPR